MANQTNNTRWYLTISILIVVIVVLAAVMGWKIKAQSDEITSKKGDITGLQSEVAGLQTQLTSAKAQLTQAQNTNTGLTADLAEANAKIGLMSEKAAVDQLTISSQDKVINTMKYPRHFNSVTELTNWLQQDDTDTKYKGLHNTQISFILQIRAARDGFLLPVRLPIGGSLDYISNMAVIGDSAYSVRGSDDFVERWMTISPAMPSYPITPGSDK